MVEAAEVAKCQANLVRASAKGYLDRLKNAIHLIGASLKETQGFRPLNRLRLLDAYLEGRARFACYLNVVHGGADRRCLLTFGNPDFEVMEHVVVRITKGEDDRRYALGRDQEPVLVDVAQLVQCPKGLTSPALVGLHIAYDSILELFGQQSEGAVLPHSTGKVVCLVGEWEPSVFALACNGVNQRADDIVQRRPQVADCIADDGFRIAVEIMERLKVVSQSVPILRLAGQSVVVCTEPAVDPGIKVRNVMACAV